jgi:hypothetical protein
MNEPNAMRRSCIMCGVRGETEREIQGWVRASFELLKIPGCEPYGIDTVDLCGRCVGKTSVRNAVLKAAR